MYIKYFLKAHFCQTCFERPLVYNDQTVTRPLMVVIYKFNCTMKNIRFISSVPAPPDLCLGKNCNNHGSCNQGVCTCTQGYTGDNCQSELKIVVVFIYLHLRLKTQQAQCQAIIYIEDIEDIHTNLIYKNTTVIIHLLYVCKVGMAIKV